jgi:predicted lipid-binding transport protein (Tim44 family)
VALVAGLAAGFGAGFVSGFGAGFVSGLAAGLAAGIVIFIVAVAFAGVAIKASILCINQNAQQEQADHALCAGSSLMQSSGQQIGSPAATNDKHSQRCYAITCVWWL